MPFTDLYYKDMSEFLRQIEKESGLTRKRLTVEYYTISSLFTMRFYHTDSLEILNAN